MAVAGVRPRIASVPCTPGGVAAVPIERTPGTPWPARVPVRIGGLQSQATVLWIGTAPDDGARSWARAPERVNDEHTSHPTRPPQEVAPDAGANPVDASSASDAQPATPRESRPGFNERIDELMRRAKKAQ